MLSITSRPAKLGVHLNVRPERHGEASVTAIDLGVTLAISEDELDTLLGVGAHDALYCQRATGSIEPRFTGIDGIRVVDKIEKASARFLVGLTRKEVKFGEVSLKSLVLTPAVGGMTELKLTVQARPEPEQIAVLSSFMDTECELDLEADAKAKGPEQSNLGLDNPPQGAGKKRKRKGRADA